MKKKTYLLLLNHYCNEKEISVYDYFYQFAVKMKSNPNYPFEGWELQDPFLTQEDYQKLLSSNDDRICEYFALAMEKVISLNKDCLSEEDYDNETINSNYDSKEDAIILDEDQDDHEQLKFPINEEKSLLEGSDIKLLTRGDIEDVVDNSFNDVEFELSREDIEDAVNEKMDDVDLDPEIVRSDIIAIVNEELDGLDEDLSREDIEGIVNEKMDGVDPELLRNDIIQVVNEEFNGIESILSDDETSLIEREASSDTKHENFFVKIGKSIANFLNGFVVFRNEEKNESDLYYFDGETNQLSNKSIISNEDIDASTGIYVNYQEYLDKLFDDVLERYPDADEFHFVDEEGKEKTFSELTEEVYMNLKEAGFVRFGREFIAKQPETYHELVEMNVEGNSKYFDKELKKGIYVRRDLLNELFSKYQVSATYYGDHSFEEISQKNVK